MTDDDELKVAEDGADTIDIAAEPTFDERSTAAVNKFNVPSICEREDEAAAVLFVVDPDLST
jgi:hypothetical protein